MPATAEQTPQSDDRSNASVAAVIEAEELREAKRDPRITRFLADAEAYVAQLESEGRSL